MGIQDRKATSSQNEKSMLADSNRLLENSASVSLHISQKIKNN